MTDRQTDRQRAAPMPKSRSSIAERDKNEATNSKPRHTPVLIAHITQRNNSYLLSKQAKVDQYIVGKAYYISLQHVSIKLLYLCASAVQM